MDHTRDNPLKRFAAFWIAVLLIGCFAIACVILRPLTHGKVDTAYEMKGEARVALVSEARSAQEATYDEAAMDKIIAAQAGQLHTQTPEPGARPVAAPAPAEAPKEDEKPAPAE